MKKERKSRSKYVIQLDNVWKIYQMGEVEVPALRGLSIKIKHGEFVTIAGPSGSGKSTAMHMVGALDLPTKGRMLLDGHNIKRLSEIEGVFKVELIALTSSVYSIMLLITFIGAIPIDNPAIWIPIGGMATGNAMNISYLTINRIKGEIDNRKEQIEAALSMGLTVIATRVGAIPDVVNVDKCEGFLIEPKDSKKMEEALLKLINNPELRK